jgi:1-acyl-sn-glycerol-3-phosphate acyltransferase
MYVEWRLTERSALEGGGVRVVIAHDLSYPLPFLTGWFARHIVGTFFVAHIAGKTLARFKVIAEAAPL